MPIHRPKVIDKVWEMMQHSLMQWCCVWY